MFLVYLNIFLSVTEDSSVIFLEGLKKVVENPTLTKIIRDDTSRWRAR